jgi:acetyl esterase/lipase
MVVAALISPAVAGEPDGRFKVEVRRDIVFAKVDGVELRLDLHLPQGVENPPLIMFIHGGGWTHGNRKCCKLRWAADHGYAVASLEYRLSQQAVFPAQIHDCKGALRWLRAHQDEYGYDAERVVVAGASAGGHLAALVGVSGGVAELEGATADHLDRSSRVQGVIDYFGPADFLLRAHSQPSKTEDPEGSVYKLLGGPVSKHEDLARLASPVTHVDAGDPPLLILHGGEDPVVLPAQSERLHAVYQEHKLESKLLIIPGKMHGWRSSTPEERETVLDFLARHLGEPGER